jgi:hypothetical protein
MQFLQSFCTRASELDNLTPSSIIAEGRQRQVGAVLSVMTPADPLRLVQSQPD